MRSVFALALSLSLVGVAGCATSSPNSPSALDSEAERRASLPTIAAIAVSDSQFSTLVAALSKAGLVDTFNGSRQYTVFAPTNTAFDNAAAALLGAGNTGTDLVNALDVGTLTAVLTYHVTLGSRNSTSLLASGQARMLDGNQTTIAVESGRATIDGAAIIAADIRASNGIVHVISSVILPPSLQ